MRSWSKTLGLALLATNLVACGAPDSGASGEEEAAEIGEPLGPTATVMTTTLPDFVNLGPSQVVYATDRCLQTVTVRSLTNGQSLSLGQFPDCATGAAVSDSSVFIASGTKIYSWDLFRGFFEIARGTSGLRGELLLDTQNVYFADSTGIKRVSRSGGTVFNLDPGSDVRLLALDCLLYTSPSPRDS